MPYLPTCTPPGKAVAIALTLVIGSAAGGTASATVRLRATPIAAPPANTPRAELAYKTVMAGPTGRPVVVGRSHLLTQSAPATNPYARPKTPSETNLRPLQRQILHNARSLSPRGIPANAPLTARQQALEQALVKRLTPLQRLTPEDILRQTFPGSKPKGN
ncbi:hypothetical protein [Thiomonas sp.]